MLSKVAWIIFPMQVFNTVYVFSSFQPIQELREVVLNILQDTNRTTEGIGIFCI